MAAFFYVPESMKFTNFNYTTGTKDRNGKAALDAFGSVRDENIRFLL